MSLHEEVHRLRMRAAITAAIGFACVSHLVVPGYEALIALAANILWIWEG